MKNLNEADFGSFGADAAGAIDSIAKHAGAAFGKLKSAHQAVTADAQAKLNKAQAKAESEAEKAAARAEKDALKGNALSGKELTLRIPRIVAQLCTGPTDPNTKEAIAPLKNLKIDQYQIVFTSINKARKRLALYPSEMRKRLMTDKFLRSDHQNKNTLNLVLGRQPEDTLAKAKEELQQNTYKEQQAWADLLALGDQASMTNMFILMQTVGAKNAKHNEERVAQGAEKNMPETLGVVKLFSSQRQVILDRLDMLNRAIETMSGQRAGDQEEEKPVTEEVLARVRAFVKTL
jgi:hypothetical protein